MQHYEPSSLTAQEAKLYAAALGLRSRSKAQAKAAAYSRLIASADFVEFLSALHKRLGRSDFYSPINDFEQGRRAAWAEIIDELNFGSGAADLVASLIRDELAQKHNGKVFHKEHEKGEKE